MPDLSKIIAAWPQVIRRSLSHWRLLSSVVIGVMMASAIMSGTVIYYDALRELALDNTLSKLTVQQTDILVKADRGPTTVHEFRQVRDKMEQEFTRVNWMLRDKIRGGKTATFFLTSPGSEHLAGQDNSRAYFAYLPRLLEHIRMVEGRLPNEQALEGSDAPLTLEALVPRDIAARYDLGIGSSLSVVPYWNDALPYARVVVSGIFERTDPNAEFWHLDDTIFKASTSPSFRTVPLYISEKTYFEVLGTSFRNMDSSYAWLLAVDTDKLNADNAWLARLSIETMENRLSRDLFSFRHLTSLHRALAEYDQRLFFSKLPMFVIMVLIAVVILYYVMTLSSLLVDQQRSEVALLRSRGASSGQVLAVFIMEGATIAALAIVVAPLLAAAVVSLLGITPFFRDLGGGARLTVSLSSGAFVMGAVGGLLSFAALMVPAVQASRISVTRHRQEAARPTTQPFFQRFYLDVMLLVASVILFRQLLDQGSVVAVGLFGEVTVNQLLLAVPALILVALALVLLRLFPLAVSYISGDSPALLHLVVAATVLILAPSIALSEGPRGEGLGWMAQVAALLALAGVYWAAVRARGTLPKLAGIAVQAGLVAVALVFGPSLPIRQVFAPILIGIVPAQLLFLLLSAFSQRAPASFSMGLWQMSRNPTQYARLSLLLILMAGLGIFAASFGGTLERNFTERALYRTGSDLRVEGVILNNTGQSVPVAEAYQSVNGVQRVAPAIRAFGSDLSRLLGENYVMLAVDTDVLTDIAWFREDFARRPLADMLGQLKHDNPPQGIPLPEDSRSIGMRLKADRAHSSVGMTARIRDANGRYFTYVLGNLDSGDWMTLETPLARSGGFGSRIPLQPAPPLTLVSLAVYESDGRRTLRAGSVSIDEIFVRTGTDQTVVIEEFDDISRWNLLKVTPESITDVFRESPTHFDGDADSALFIWSEGSPLTSRGIFHGPPVSPLPVLASDSFLRETGHRVGDAFEVSVRGHRVPIRIVDSFDFFPTLDTFNERHLISDVASLTRYANLNTTYSELRPDEVWLETRVNGVERAQLVEALRTDGPFINRSIVDRAQVLADSRVDPLIEAGWRALLFMAFAAVLILSCVGFLVHTYVSVRSRELQFALMRTIGFSMRQMTALISLEQVLVILTGLALGTWMGGRLGAIIMPFLAHDDRGSQVLPPFVLEVNWATLAMTYGAMVLVFALIIVGAVVFIRKISLQRILRLGEL